MSAIYYGVDLKATGENITRLRLKSGLTVRDIQSLVGLESPNAIYQWERGRNIPTVEHLMVLSHIFGVDIQEIIVWSRTPDANN